MENSNIKKKKVNIKLGVVPWRCTAPTTGISSPKYLEYGSACRS